MTKFIAVAVMVTLSLPLLAFAADGGGSDGCGLGWQVTQKKSFLATTTRGTTNAVVPPSFGMTSGTIGCDQHSFAKNDQKAAEFVASNYEPLMMNIASGRGEYLDAFAQTMNCKDAASFGSEMQKNYPSISSPNAVQFFYNVKSAIQTDPTLAANCTII